MKKTAARWGAALLSSILLFTQVIFSPAWVEASELDFWRSRAIQRSIASSQGLPLAAPAAFPFLTANINDFAHLNNRPSNNASKPTMVLIQDIHHNVEAQKNIGEILKRTKAVAIGVEAAEGAFNFEPYRAFPVPSSTKHIADYLLAEDLISGASWAGLSKDSELPTVNGVDDPALYSANIRAYQEAAPEQTRALTQVGALFTELSAKREELSPRARMLLDAFFAFHRGENTIAEYLSVLHVAADSSTPNVSAFQFALKLEKNLRLSVVEQERDRFIVEMAHRNPQEVARLTRLAKQVATGEVSPLELYGQLAVDPARYPALDIYIRYLKAADKIDRGRLFVELSALRRKAISHLSLQQYETHILNQAISAMLMDKLVRFEMTPEEWTEYKSERKIPFAAYESFYALAEARNMKMAENMLKALSREKVNIGVLVAGGFHTAGLSEIFRAKGFDVVVVTPKFNVAAAGAGSDYLKIFLKERTPLANLVHGEKVTLGDAAQQMGAINSIPGRSSSSVIKKFVLLAAAFAASANLASAQTTQALYPIAPTVQVETYPSGSARVDWDNESWNVGPVVEPLVSDNWPDTNERFSNVPGLGDVEASPVAKNTSGLVDQLTSISMFSALIAVMFIAPIASMIITYLNRGPHSIDQAISILENNRYVDTGRAARFLLKHKDAISHHQFFKLIKLLDTRAFPSATWYMLAELLSTDVAITKVVTVFARHGIKTQALILRVMNRFKRWFALERGASDRFTKEMSKYPHVKNFFGFFSLRASAVKWDKQHRAAKLAKNINAKRVAVLLAVSLPFLTGAKSPEGTSDFVGMAVIALLSLPVIVGMVTGGTPEVLHVESKGGRYVLVNPRKFLAALNKAQRTKATIKNPYRLMVDGRAVDIAELVIEKIENDSIAVVNPIPVIKPKGFNVDEVIDSWINENEDGQGKTPAPVATEPAVAPRPQRQAPQSVDSKTIKEKPHVKPSKDAEQAFYFVLSHSASPSAHYLLEQVLQGRESQSFPTLHVLMNTMFLAHVHEESVAAQKWLPTFFREIRNNDSSLNMDSKTRKDAMSFIEQMENEKTRIDRSSGSGVRAKMLLPFIPFLLFTQMAAKSSGDYLSSPILTAFIISLTLLPIVAMAVQGNSPKNVDMTPDGYVLLDPNGAFLKKLRSHPDIRLQNRFLGGDAIPVKVAMTLHFGSVSVPVTMLSLKQDGDRILIIGALNDKTSVWDSFPPLPPQAVVAAPGGGVRFELKRGPSGELMLIEDILSGPMARLPEADPRRINFFNGDPMTVNRPAQLKLNEKIVTVTSVSFKRSNDGSIVVVDAMYGKDPVLGEFIFLRDRVAKKPLSDDDAFAMIMGENSVSGTAGLLMEDEGAKDRSASTINPNPSGEKATQSQPQRPSQPAQNKGQAKHVDLKVDVQSEEVMRYLTQTVPAEHAEVVKLFYRYVSALTKAGKIKPDFPLSRGFAYLFLHSANGRDGERIQSWIKDLFSNIVKGDISLNDPQSLTTAQAFVKQLTKVKPLMMLFVAAFIVFTQVAASYPGGVSATPLLAGVSFIFSAFATGVVIFNRDSAGAGDDGRRIRHVIHNTLRVFGQTIKSRASLEEALKIQKVNLRDARVQEELSALQVEFPEWAIIDNALANPVLDKAYRLVVRNFWKYVARADQVRVNLAPILMRDHGRENAQAIMIDAENNGAESLKNDGLYATVSSAIRFDDRDSQINVPSVELLANAERNVGRDTFKVIEENLVMRGAATRAISRLVSDERFYPYLTRLMYLFPNSPAVYLTYTHNVVERVDESPSMLRVESHLGARDIILNLKLDDEDRVIGLYRVFIQLDGRNQHRYSALLREIIRILIISDLIKQNSFTRAELAKIVNSPYFHWRAMARMYMAHVKFGLLGNSRENILEEMNKAADWSSMTQGMFDWMQTRFPHLYRTIMMDLGVLPGGYENQRITTVNISPSGVTVNVDTPSPDRYGSNAIPASEYDRGGWLKGWNRVFVLLFSVGVLSSFGATGGSATLTLATIGVLFVGSLTIAIVAEKILERSHKASLIYLPLETFALSQWKNERPSLIEVGALNVHNVSELDAMYTEALGDNSSRRLNAIRSRLSEINRQIVMANHGRGAVLLVGTPSLTSLQRLMRRAGVNKIPVDITGVRFSEEQIGEPIGILEKYKDSYNKVRIYALAGKYWAFDKKMSQKLSAEEIGRLVIEVMNWQSFQSVDVTSQVMAAMASLRAA